MRVSATKPVPRVEPDKYLTRLKIKEYGQGNDYPQKIIDIIESSGTGKSCVGTYVRFIEGLGFKDKALGSLILNTRRERADKIMHKCARDLRYFNGFALLVKYNGMLQAVELFHIPFEHCRLEIDKDKNFTGRIAVHPDWTKATGKMFKDQDIKYVDFFDPSKVGEQMREIGPIDYLGQIYYFTMDGDLQYPICPFDAVVTDMLTEESISTIKHRNAKYNFLPSGILVRKGIKPNTNADGTYDLNDPLNREQEDSRLEIVKMQGDNNTSKIWIVDIDTDEEKPEFIDFTAKNYDMQYRNTETTIQENIASMFMIPPVLRAKDVAVGLAANVMEDAYNFMNAITTSEREALKDVFQDIFTVLRQKSEPRIQIEAKQYYF